MIEAECQLVFAYFSINGWILVCLWIALGMFVQTFLKDRATLTPSLMPYLFALLW